MSNFIYKQFGAKLKEIRKSYNCSQKTLADAIAINPVTVSQIERGLKFVSGNTLYKICDYFNIAPHKLFDFETDINNDRLFNDIVDKIKKHPKKLEEVHRIVLAILNE